MPPWATDGRARTVAIFRQGPRPEDNFTQVPNALYQDPNIPVEAKGLYGYMRSHRDGWVMTTERIGKANGMSKNRAAKYINILIDLGYIIRSQTNENGRFGETEYMILSTPCTKNRDTVSESANSQLIPEPKKPDHGKPAPRKIEPYNKTNINNTNIKKDQGGMEGVEEPEPTGLGTGQDSQSPPQSLDELAEMHAVATSDDICPQHPYGNHDDVPCHGCRQVRVRQQQEAARREAERKGAVVRELRKRNESYTPPKPPTVDKYPSGVAEIDCAGCGASSGEQCMRGGKPAMLPCGERLRAAKSHPMTG